MINSFFKLIKLIPLLAILLSVLNISIGCDSIVTNIIPANNYPRWLKTEDYQPSQTSGITFINESEDGKLQFLLVDDIGKIHRFFIEDDTVFSFSEIKLSPEVQDYLEDFPKIDFEEIFFDKYSGDVYLTIEGNGEDYISYHGVFKLKFVDNDIFQDSITGLIKLEFKPVEAFNEYLRWNVGYEGFTADENYFYLGLENVQTPDGKFTDNTVIRIAEKESLEIIKEISTERLGIATICGLYSDENYSIWGIDRNHKKVFKLNFDEYFNVTEKNLFELKTVIPGYTNLEYVGSLESITFVSEDTIYLVDDPWHTYFIPTDEILNQLDESTKENFENFIPVIYKFDIE
jgi:hypothetical protein